MLIRKSSLVGECIDDVHAHLASPTVGSGGCDGISDTAVHQPTWAALVEALVPRGIHLPGCGQRGVEFLTVLHGLLKGEAVVVAGEEDLTLKRNESIEELKRLT